MILNNHDLETFYRQYKIYINDKQNINFSHFIILQLDSIWRAASGALASHAWCVSRQGAAAEHAWSGVHVLVLNLVYTRVPYFSITVYSIDTMVVIWIQQIINYGP